MGNAVSEFKTEVQDMQDRRGRGTLTPTNQDGKDPRCRSVSRPNTPSVPPDDVTIYNEFVSDLQAGRDSAHEYVNTDGPI